MFITLPLVFHLSSDNVFFFFVGFLQLQQLVDSFIILASQNSAETPVEHRGLLLNKSATNNNKGNPWSKFSPANIRVAPFPTRAYTDDEFQSIIKKVMAVLYVFFCLLPPLICL